ncbi:hypothetical protein HPB49_019330 [Dermacentor silvarum]|uniref:Uncharacterized protein n=1 Tax=Dermacentor silvarum TaxID=543639 RepID=A0ACB8E2P8_DERSI|nr:hypothetical protein HPB49_019330 [Dermacentor silvarum]
MRLYLEEERVARGRARGLPAAVQHALGRPLSVSRRALGSWNTVPTTLLCYQSAPHSRSARRFCWLPWTVPHRRPREYTPRTLCGTAKDRVRQTLDEFMGTGWDGVKNSLQYSDPKVCRCFLLGLSPHDALAGTKISMGACSKGHNYALKADFENSSRMYRLGQHRFYDLMVLTYLQKV